MGGNSPSTIESMRKLALDSMFRFGQPKLDMNQELIKQKKVSLKIVLNSLECKLCLSFILLSIFSYMKTMIQALIFDLFVIEHIEKVCLYSPACSF